MQGKSKQVCCFYEHAGYPRFAGHEFTIGLKEGALSDFDAFNSTETYREKLKEIYKNRLIFDL